MGEKMTWEEIKKNFPNEWVAVVNYTSNSATGGVDGEVVFHSNNKDKFYEKAKDVIVKYHGMAMRYTGERIKNAETPLLWQITHTA
jgi:hypothetical protein